MNCKNILLLYEGHSDILPSEIIIDMLQLFNNYNMDSAVCLEEPSDHKKHQTYDNLITQHQQIISNPIDSFYHQYVQNFTPNIKIAGKRFKSFAEMDNALSNTQKQQVVDDITSYFKAIPNSLAATISIIEKAQKYSNMDLPYKTRQEVENTHTPSEARELRDNHMAKKIADQCNNVEDFVIALVGAKHFSIATKLNNAGYHVSEFWAIGKVPKDFSNKDKSILCMLNPKELSDTERKEYCAEYTWKARVFDATNSKLTHQDITNEIIECPNSSIICESLSYISDTLSSLAGCASECKILTPNEDL